MEVIRYILMVVVVLNAFLLIGVILLQKSKGGGMGTAFGGGIGESIFGAQIGNVLTKITVVLAVTFLSVTTILAWIGARQGGSSIADGISTAPIPGTQQPVMPSGNSGNPSGAAQ